MLKGIIDFSLKQKFVALSLVVLMAFGGIRALMEIPINSLPDVTPEQVLVITKAGRYSPFDVERLVSYPIETAMNGLPDVKEVRSISQFGLSAVTIEFEEGTDTYFARQLVSQRVQSIADELPEGVDTPQSGLSQLPWGKLSNTWLKEMAIHLRSSELYRTGLLLPSLKPFRE